MKKMSEGTRVSTGNYLLPAVMDEEEETGIPYIYKDIIAVVSLISNVSGILGSCLIIAVMRLSKFKSMPRSLFYFSLAVVDLLLCLYLMINTIVNRQYGVTLDLISHESCQMDRFVRIYLPHMDAWLLIALSGERLIAIVKPLNIGTIVTMLRVKVILVTMLMFFLIWDVELSVTSGIVNQPDYLTNTTMATCTRVNYYNFSAKIMASLDNVSLLFGSFIPCIIIFKINVVLSINLFKLKRARADLGATGSGIQNEAHKITGMVMAASLQFLVTTTPLVIYILLGNLDQNDPIHMILITIYQINPAANFYMYFLSGSLFRQEVKKLFSACCCRKR